MHRESCAQCVPCALPAAPVQWVLLPLQHCAPQGSCLRQPATWSQSPHHCVGLAWGLPGATLRHRAVRQCPCPVPSWLSCSRAELWSWPKKEARDEVLRLQLAFLYKLPLGRIFCPKPWAGGFVPWEECLPFGCHWFLSCLSLYQPCLVAGQEQFAANFFKLAGKLVLQISVPCLFTYL